MADKVWVVEQGQYSAYRVVGVFSSQENAERIAAAINAEAEADGDDPATVDEWPLDPAVDALRHGYQPHEFSIRRDGTVERCVPTTVDSRRLAGGVGMWRGFVRPGGPEEQRLYGMVWAKDVEHAVKIANEHRTRFIAEERWPAEPTE